MKRWARLMVCALVCAVNALALDREAFTFTSYDLDARVEPEQQRLGVRGKTVLRNDSNSAQKNAVLQISSTLSWRSIQAEDKPLQFVTQPYQSDIDHTGALSEAIVTLPREIPPKGTVELEIGYEGTIPLDTTRLTRIGTPKEIAARVDWDQMSQSFSAVRGVGHVAWYPVATESANLSEDSVFETLGRWQTKELQAEMKISLHYQRGSTEAAPILWCNGKGNRTPTEISRAQLLTTTCSFQPLHFAVPSFVIGNYEVLSGTNGDIYYERTHKSGAEDFTLAAELAAPFVAEWFGKARDKVEVLDVANLRISPYENDRMLLTSLDEINSKQAQVALAHELTHAAFYSPREWIYEGLAHFAQALYRERQDGRSAALDYMALHREELAEAENEAAQPVAAASAGNSPSSAHAPLGTTFDEVYYGIKAPYVWWMLRDMVGDDALKKALAAYRPEQDKEPGYMQHLIATEAKRDLGWFFDDWVYRDRGLPDFRVASVYPHEIGQSRYLVTITVENLGSAGAEVPVTLRTEQGEMMKRVEVRAKATGIVRMETLSQPVEVVVNDGSVPETDLENNVYKITAGGK